ncbi:MAG: histidine--tRNA ligase [Bdellovibrionales bacterium]|nr:histidine--tRNA ligase [Bdellovibrionales bacterium]
MKLQTVRGTRDLLGAEAQVFREIMEGFAQIAGLYDFQEIVTPIFEFTPTFQKTLGEASDIVNKEMYTFEDRGGESLTLRPEGTAGVARAVISNSLLRDLPLKLFYSGPMFRYERPQKGRYRQFYQIGVELLGVDKPIADIEVMAMAQKLFQHFGISEKIQLELNTLGDDASRAHYREKLIDFLTPFLKDLSEDSQRRFQTNPLRILDSKDEKDQDIVTNAPKLGECLNDSSKVFFDQVQEGLTSVGLKYTINDQLVRGLDYYCHTVFEFTTTALGSQNAVLSGGRYDGLIQGMGGPATPGVGWGAGVDRMALLIGEPKTSNLGFAVIAIDEISEPQVLPLLEKIRGLGQKAQPIYSGNASKKMKKAHKRGCRWAVVIGEQELKTESVQLKDFESGEQKTLSNSEFEKWLKNQ